MLQIVTAGKSISGWYCSPTLTVFGLLKNVVNRVVWMNIVTPNAISKAKTHSNLLKYNVPDCGNQP